MRDIETITRIVKAESAYLEDHYQHGGTSLDADGIAKMEAAIGEPRPTNEEKSALEVHNFKAMKPNHYTAYMSLDGKHVTTWTGDKLASCRIKNVSKSNMDDDRHYFSADGVNGIKYHGWGAPGALAYLTAYKNQ